jgi:hypothetical protein
VVVVNSGPTIDQLKQETPGLFQQVLGGLLGGIVAALRAALAAATSLNFLGQTPPDLSYRQPDVRRLWAAMRGVAMAALALVTLVGGYNVLVREHLGLRSDGAREVLARVLVGALLVNTSLWWASAAIDLENALCGLVGTAGFPGWDRLATTASVALWTPASLLAAVAVLLYLAVCLLLAIQMLMRLVFVDVLLIVAPLGLLCRILPQTQRWSRWWSTAFISAIATQFLQVTALVLANNLLTAIGSGGAGDILGPFMGLATLVLVLKLPGLVDHQLSDGWGLLRGVLVGQAIRAVAPSAGAARAVAGAGRPSMIGTGARQGGGRDPLRSARRRRPLGRCRCCRALAAGGRLPTGAVRRPGHLSGERRPWQSTSLDRHGGRRVTPATSRCGRHPLGQWREHVL